MSFNLTDTKTVMLMPLEVPKDKNAPAVRSAICAMLKSDCNMFTKGEIIKALMLLLEINEKQVADELGLSQESIKRKLSLLCFSEFERKKLLSTQTCEMSASLLSKLPPITRRFAVLYCTKSRLSFSKTKAYVETLISAKKPLVLKIKNNNKKQKSAGFINNIGFVINSIENAVTTAGNSGFELEYDKKDDGDFFDVSLYISKKPRRNH